VRLGEPVCRHGDVDVIEPLRPSIGVHGVIP
jgi:hypothetical protein